MKIKTLEEELEICPYADTCAVEYGGADICKEERDYENCVIFKELKQKLGLEKQ